MGRRRGFFLLGTARQRVSRGVSPHCLASRAAPAVFILLSNVRRFFVLSQQACAARNGPPVAPRNFSPCATAACQAGGGSAVEGMGKERLREPTSARVVSFWRFELGAAICVFAGRSLESAKRTPRLRETRLVLRLGTRFSPNPETLRAIF